MADTYTKEDLETTRDITDIKGKVNSLTDTVTEVKKDIKELLSRNTSIKDDLMATNNVANEAKRLADKHEVEITALQVRNNATDNKVKGAGIVWRTILAVIGLVSLLVTATLGIISIVHQIIK